MNSERLRARLASLPRRLTLQLSLLLAILLCLAILVHGLISARTQTARMTELVRANVATLSKSLATTVLPAILVDDLSGLEGELLEHVGLPGTSEILVTDRNGRVRSRVIQVPGRTARPLYEQSKLVVPDKVAQQLVIEPDGDLLGWTPVVSGDGLVAWVRLRYSLDEVRAVGSRALREAVVIASVALAISLGLLFLYLRRPLQAIRSATAFAASLHARRGEELAVQAETEEIGQLQRALNHASKQLWEEHRALLETTERLEAVLTHTADGILTFDEQGRIESANPAAEQIFATPAETLRGTELNRYIPDWRSAGRGRHHELRGRRRDGSAFPLELSCTEMWVGNRRLHAATVRDLTESKRLEQLSSRLGRILEHSSNEVYIFDARTLRFVQVSQGALANLGYTAEEMQQLTPIDIKPGMNHEQFAQLIEPLRQGAQQLVQFETTHRRKNGSLYPVEVRLQLSRGEEPPVFMAIIQDITVRKHAEARLVYLANYDTLTDLPNRTLLGQRLNHAIDEAENNERLVAVLFIDLDRFKVINDTLGHDAGDELLKVVARRLTEALRPGDTVARYGGDEFVAILANVAHVDDVTRVVNKMLGKLSPAITIGGRELFVTPSIGITLCPFDDRTGDDLLRNADTAMFQAKEEGGNTFRFYTADLNARVQRRLALETSLRHALEHGELLLHYQPQIDTRSGDVVAVEALVRWQHPEWGLVAPAEFIPLAEETGLILPIGEWVLREACAQARTWQASGQPALRVAVNLSGRQLAQVDLIAMIQRVLDSCKLAHGLLELEITESLLMQDLEQTAATLDRLAQLGVTVSMDDFGTGYSSLSYLKRLPIDVLKIDRSFVRDITTDPNDAAIVQAIIAMAHSLGIKVVAEGVETAEQLAFLQRQQCDSLQGHYFSRPLPPERFTELLREKRRVRA